MDNNGTLYVHAMEEFLHKISKDTSSGSIIVICGMNEKTVDSVCRESAIKYSKLNKSTLVDGSAVMFHERSYHDWDTICFPQAENGLHYIHQLGLAKEIVHAVACHDITVFLTTYSTIMLRSIEVFGNREPLVGKGRIHYYLIGENGINDLHGKTSSIYREFYLPFEEL